jgi:hypothetical protein
MTKVMMMMMMMMMMISLTSNMLRNINFYGSPMCIWTQRLACGVAGLKYGKRKRNNQSTSHMLLQIL